jgi:hypothetical protein
VHILNLSERYGDDGDDDDVTALFGI